MEEDLTRLDAEWAFVSAVRELIKIASKGDAKKSSYDRALELGGSLYPEKYSVAARNTVILYAQEFN